MKQHHSRMDFLTILVNLLTIFLVDIAGLLASSQALVPQSGITALGLFVVAVTLPVALFLFFYPIRYLLGHSELIVSSGVLRWRIPIENIHRAVRLRSIVPSPALSAERIRIDYSKGTLVKRLFLSPADRTSFLEDLAALDSGFTHQQDGLIRRSGQILILQDLAP